MITTKHMSLVVVEDTHNSWTEMEERVCEATNMAFMLAATAGICEEDRDKREAMHFGI